MSKKQSQKSSGSKGRDQAQSGGKSAGRAKRERKPGELSRPQKAVIIVFIVIFALSTLAGALATVFQSSNQSVEYDVDYVDSQYEPVVDELESKVEADPSDTDSLLSLAQSCQSWGQMVEMLAQNDDERAHGTELLERARGYYDQCLEQGESPDARTGRAMCSYYLGDTDGALADLQSVTQSSPDYAQAWADLGMLYEVQGSDDEAIAAYEQAVANDPDDEAGAKSYAQGRLDELTGDDAGSDEAGTDDAGSDDAADGTTDAASDGTTDDAAAADSTTDDTGASE